MSNAQEKNIWGITGNMAMGKTTVCKFLEGKIDVRIFPCDLIAKNILKADRLNQKKELMEIDQANISEEENLRRIEKYVHPKVWQNIESQLEVDDKEIFIVESAILYEKRWNEKIQNIIVVHCSAEKQWERLKKDNPNIKSGNLMLRLSRQWPVELKMQLASIVVENNGTLKELEEKVEKLYSIISSGPVRERIVL